MRRRQQRSVDTRERILNAAFFEFAEFGFEGSSTRSIATKADVRHALVTHHFESKEGLWKAVMTTVQKNFLAYFDGFVHGEDGADDVERLRHLQEVFIRFSAAFPAYHWLMADVGRRDSELLTWFVDARGSTYFGTIAKLIVSAQKQGRYVAGDPYHLQYLFIGAVTRIFMQEAEVKHFLKRSLKSKQFVEEHVRLCCGLFFRDPSAEVAAPAAKAAGPKAAAVRAKKPARARPD